MTDDDTLTSAIMMENVMQRGCGLCAADVIDQLTGSVGRPDNAEHWNRRPGDNVVNKMQQQSTAYTTKNMF